MVRLLTSLVIVYLLSSGCAGVGQLDSAVAAQGLQQDLGSHERSVSVSVLLDNGTETELMRVFESEHKVRFSVYVPETYSVARPSGVVVFVTPMDIGEIPDDWKPVFDRRNLIWVSVSGSGNTMGDERRIAETKLSYDFITRNYSIDSERTFLSGMSGGARISIMAAARYPEIFKGGVYLSGAEPWSERNENPWLKETPENFEAIKGNRYVLVSGTEDFKLSAVARLYRDYKKLGIEKTRLIVVQDLDHDFPDAEIYDRALDYLEMDGP